MNHSATIDTAAIVAPETRDLPRLQGLLSGWLADKLGTRSKILVTNLAYPLGAGMSHETILFDAIWSENGVERQQGMVVRIKPTGKTVYLDDMFDEQYRLMQLMYESGQVRVARPLWFEPDAGLLGAPFFVMQRMLGRVPVSYPPYSRQGWLFDATPQQRARAWEDAVRQLAAIQFVSTRKAAFLELPGGADHFGQEIDRWARYLDWVDPEHHQLLLRNCWNRLMARYPANRPEGIVWGDARIGNMMFGSDFQVVAVMDWEQPSLGGALHDLGWWLCSDFIQTTVQGLTPLQGLGSREATLSLWREVSGKSTADIDWYVAFAFFKMETTGIRLSTLRELPGQMKASHIPGTITQKFVAELG